MTFDDFEEDYNDLADDISAAGHNTYEQKLLSWFALLDGFKVIQTQLENLENSFDFQEWYQAGKTTNGGMVGSGHLEWAEDPKQKITQQLALFRYFASQEGAYIQFCSMFLFAGSSYDEMVWKINSEHFEPFQRDLLKFLKRNRKSSKTDTETLAQDFVSVLDQSSTDYRYALQSLSTAIVAIQQNNEIGENEPDEKERVIAELHAGKSLLQLARVRGSVIWSLIKDALLWGLSKTTETAIGALITVALTAIAGLLGIPYL